MNKATTKKEKAIELMKKLDIYKPYISGFENSGRVCFFENYGGFWVDQEPLILSKIKELEEKYNCLVYAVTHEMTSIGEMYDFLIVSAYLEEWDDTLLPAGNGTFYAYAYVWNVNDDYCSEFADIVVHSFGGGIKRIA